MMDVSVGGRFAAAHSRTSGGSTCSTRYVDIRRKDVGWCVCVVDNKGRTTRPDRDDMISAVAQIRELSN